MNQDGTFDYKELLRNLIKDKLESMDEKELTEVNTCITQILTRKDSNNGR